MSGSIVFLGGDRDGGGRNLTIATGLRRVEAEEDQVVYV